MEPVRNADLETAVVATPPFLWTLPRPFRRVLVVAAHPDDAEFGAAATIARWVKDGTDVRYLILTDGAAGSSDPTMTRERLVPLRAEEQRAACAELGVSDVAFLGYPDGYLQPTIGARRHVAAEIRRHRPEAVMTLNPDIRWTARGRVNHPDHRAAGDLVLHSINPAASSRLWDMTLLDEGLEPWDVSELWMMGFGAGPHHVDVTATFDRKIAALRRHASQLRDWDPEERMRQMAEESGRQVGVAHSEAFTVLRFRELEADADGE